MHFRAKPIQNNTVILFSYLFACRRSVTELHFRYEWRLASDML